MNIIGTNWLMSTKLGVNCMPLEVIPLDTFQLPIINTSITDVLNFETEEIKPI